MITVNKFMCHTDLMVGCVIIGLINSVLSCIFFIYTIFDIYYHNVERDGHGRHKRSFHESHYERRGGPVDFFVLIKSFLFIIYFLHFIYCIFLISAALKKSTKYVKRYITISIVATVAACSEGILIFIYGGITEMALNYFAFTLWNIYFIICVNSYYLKFSGESQRNRREDQEGSAEEIETFN